MQTGFLKVQVSSAYEAVPVAGAVVTITAQDGSVSYRVSDASGRCAPLELPCPDAELSQQPDFAGEVFALCDVTVQADRFAPMTVLGVQIFGGQTAVLPLSLQPIALGSAYAKLNEGRTVNIPPELVSERSGSAGSDPAPQVLERVVVPDYITVHLGRPTAYAENVTVSFPDYIKNVCCSEIYPTWPESALRANIYCQVSLALNRIFTEWYRSRGYDFDITNSTQYDQYFVKGRNIYDNVSELVDELFDNYIRREGSLEPLFSSYCNGTTATCDGLTQWGSEELASQGFSPFQILQYYYGDDIVIDQAPQASGVIASYPGTALRRGSRGDAVRTIQTQLLRICRNYPLIPNLGEADGVFGSRTEEAVRVFQGVFNLTQDGVVGKATWYKISYIYVAVTRVAELTSEGIPRTPVIPATRPTSVLRQGSSGEDVRLAQFLLNLSAAFYGGGYNPIAVDGSFGSATANAVLLFQGIRGISQDGVVGSATWANLLNVYYSVQNTVSGSNPAYPGSPLQKGSSGAAVQLVQRYLNIIASYYGEITPVAIDGVFGSGTQQAVMQFQRMFALPADGVVGPATWNQLISVYNSLTAGSAYFSVAAVPAGLRQGMRSSSVSQLQRQLSVVGQRFGWLGEPETDGFFGERTERAVSQLQGRFKLPATGIADGDTLRWLRWSFLRAVGRAPELSALPPGALPPAEVFAAAGGAAGEKAETEQPEMEQEKGQTDAAAALAPQPSGSAGEMGGSSGGGAVVCSAEQTPGGTLLYGDSSSGVLLLQQQLCTVGEVYRSVGCVKQDGKFGQETFAAVAEFQRIFGLPDDGVYGSRTAARMKQKLCDIAAGKPPVETPVYSGVVYRQGSSGPWVRMIQRYLDRAGQYYASVGRLEADGIFGPATERAVLQFQRLFRLRVDGAVGYDTFGKLRQIYNELVSG